LDKALHSDQYFWAEGKLVWHLGMVERGVRMLRDTILAVPDAEEVVKLRAQVTYDKIIQTGKASHGEEVKE